MKDIHANDRRPLAKLLTHLTITAMTFNVILVLAWSASYLTGWLHELRPFPPETYRFLAVAGRWLLYVDVAVAASILLIGAMHFIRATWEAK